MRLTYTRTFIHPGLISTESPFGTFSLDQQVYSERVDTSCTGMRKERAELACNGTRHGDLVSLRTSPISQLMQGLSGTLM